MSEFCPYRGLEPYTEEERDYFFGREEEQETIGANLLTSPLTILYGTSGVGKSSVLLAGVVPYLHSTPNVVTVVFREWQTGDFLANLKKRIGEEIRSAAGATIDISVSLDNLLAEAVTESGCTVTLILDQFEEYFFYHRGGEVAGAFESQFASVVNRGDLDAPILLSIRDDSLSSLDRFRGMI